MRRLWYETKAYLKVSWAFLKLKLTGRTWK
jgi:hypothetical protein